MIVHKCKIGQVERNEDGSWSFCSWPTLFGPKEYLYRYTRFQRAFGPYLGRAFEPDGVEVTRDEYLAHPIDYEWATDISVADDRRYYFVADDGRAFVRAPGRTILEFASEAEAQQYLRSNPKRGYGEAEWRRRLADSAQAASC